MYNIFAICKNSIFSQGIVHPLPYIFVLFKILANEYALSTKRCILGNQDRYLARVVLFLLCSPILSPLEVVSRKVFDEFTQLNKVRNFCHIFSTLLDTCS